MRISKRIRRFILSVAAMLSAGFIVYVYAHFNPESSNLFPKCIFLQLTGIRCPGCGSQRALHALLTGDLATAFRFNAFLVSMLPYLATLAFASIFRRRIPRLYSTLTHPALIFTIFVLVILWWISRNIFVW